MSFDNILSGTVITGAALGLLVAFWSRAKALAWRAASLVVVRFTIEDQAAEAVQMWLWKHGRRSRFGERAFSGANVFVRPVDRRLVVGYETIGRDQAVFWIGNRPLVATLAGQSVGGAYLGDKLTLTFLRGTFDHEAMIIKAVDELNQLQHGGEERRFSVQRMTGNLRRRGPSYDSEGQAYPSSANGPPGNEKPSNEQSRRYLKWKREEIGSPISIDPLGPLAFPPEVDVLVEEAQQWLASERWYKERRIPWRIGWLFYGLPGTGKTSLAKAVAVTLDLPLFAIELGTFDDAGLIQLWQKLLQNAPCMILLEDIDTVFVGRENRLNKDGNGLTFGCLLNCISGAEGSDGIMLVVTTNKIEDVDSALGVPDENDGRSTRPGRIDRAVELRELSEECRERIAKRILADCPHEIERLVSDGAGMTGAQFQDICSQVALAWHWNKQTRLPQFSANGKDSAHA